MVRVLFTLLLGFGALVLIPSSSVASEFPSLPPALLDFHLPVAQVVPPSSLPPPTPVATWTLLGCWKSRPWLTTCLDVFRDDAGALYICKACGTTGNPNKGKCRQTTQSELDSGTWCSAVE
jgi:hypothetical protein